MRNKVRVASARALVAEISSGGKWAGSGISSAEKKVEAAAKKRKVTLGYTGLKDH